MSFHPAITICVLAALFFNPSTLMSQMPDWKYFRDRDGNTYFIDQTGNIRIPRVSRYAHGPVSATGIDYHLHYGITLIKDHRLKEGLSVLKSILALPVSNNRIYNAQVKAAEIIHALKRRQGTRYAALNESAALALVRLDSSVKILNDLMFYSVRVPAMVEIIRVRDRIGANYRYSGLLAGIRKHEDRFTDTERGGYDMLLAVDSEKFSAGIKDLAQAVAKWGENLGYDGLRREVVSESDTGIVYQFMNNGPPRYRGMEGIFINGAFTHCVRLVSSDLKYKETSGVIRQIIDSFKTASQNN